MLQQTQVNRVVERWPQFMAQFPTPLHCANATSGDVIAAWSGLGYNRRARNLHRAATAITAEFGGRVPTSSAQLRSLPGVGAYTSRAVASFAFGECVGVVDTNVGRVLARAVANATLSARVAQNLADELVGDGPSASINQAMLDVGARHCRREPRCSSCPLRTLCVWRREGGADPAVASAGVSRPQPTFLGSRRQARGRIIAALREGPLHVGAARAIAGSFEGVVEELVAEGLAARTGSSLTLPR
jgi:A/G-specific adenine glycosylase